MNYTHANFVHFLYGAGLGISLAAGALCLIIAIVRLVSPRDVNIPKWVTVPLFFGVILFSFLVDVFTRQF